jgi:ABC-type uncharacterized transport system auxiliary subunit
MTQARGCWPLLAALTALPGCFSGLNSKTPAPQRYLLQAQLTSAAAPARSAASVQVLRPSAAPGLAGSGIAVLRSGSRLDFYSNADWAADVPVALQGLIIDALRMAGGFATVESDSGPFAAQYVLSLDLEHFEASYEQAGPPTVQVTLICTLGRRSDRSVLVSFTAQGTARADADRMQAVIAAFERATSEALSQVAQSVVPPAVGPAQP